MIDWARVVELRNEIGVEDFDEVVDLFLSEVEDRVAVLSVEKALSDLEEDMHFLKGSALNLGFTAFAQLCNEGESKAKAGSAVVDISKVEASFEESKKRFLSNLAQEIAS